MKAKKELTVVMPFYRESLEMAKSSIRSVLNQSYENFELIIILDSPENKKVENYLRATQKSDNRVVFLKNKTNKGAAYSRNKAIRMAKGKFIAFADGDDINKLDRFEKQISFMKKNKKIDACFSNMDYVNENGVVFGSSNFNNADIKYFSKNPFRSGNVFNNPTFFGKKKIFEEEVFDERIRIIEDFDLWIRLEKKNNFAILPENLVKYRHQLRNQGNNFLKMYKKHFISNFFNLHFHFLGIINFVGLIFSSFRKFD